MRKILFVINSLTIGGSERSLISLLNQINYSLYEVDLMMFRRGEEFDKYLPKEVNVLDEPNYYKYVTINTRIPFFSKVKFNLIRIITALNLRIKKYKKKINHTEQVLYRCQKNVLDNLKKEYDVAIAFSQGMPTYFVVDKVRAKRKLAWINCDYVNTTYDKDFDKNYYKRVDKIIVVSKAVKESMVKSFPEYKEKLELVLDIVSPQLIYKMAKQETNLFNDKSKINILTVGRLIIHHKGYDTAIQAARLLKKNNYRFKWYVIGEGRNRAEIEKLILKYDLNDCFILLGKKENPYPYMHCCDLYIQPSKKEGFGLTVIEAKILKKLIICTNFNTSNELINNEIDGLIVNNTPEDVFNGIKRYIEDINFKNRILAVLEKSKPYSSIKEIEKIYQLVN